MNDLIQQAKDIIKQRYVQGKFAVGAAVKTKSGKIYTGISINSQKLDICSEWSAIGQAFSKGDFDIDMVVAVKQHRDGTYEIYPPCALCRELYLTYCPDVKVIISEAEVVEARKLLPHAWQKKVI